MARCSDGAACTRPAAEAMAAVSDGARVARLELSGGIADPATLQQGMAAIDAKERSKLESLRAGVYVGFHELEALMPGAHYRGR